MRWIRFHSDSQRRVVFMGSHLGKPCQPLLGLCNRVCVLSGCLCGPSAQAVKGSECLTDNTRSVWDCSTTQSVCCDSVSLGDFLVSWYSMLKQSLSFGRSQGCFLQLQSSVPKFKSICQIHLK